MQGAARYLRDAAVVTLSGLLAALAVALMAQPRLMLPGLTPRLRIHNASAVDLDQLVVRLPWSSVAGTAPPALWFHDLLDGAGTPFAQSEVNVVRAELALAAASRIDYSAPCFSCRR